MSGNYFIEDTKSSSSSEEEDKGHRRRSRYWTRSRPALNDSPPAVLAFSITSGGGQQRNQSPEPGPSQPYVEADGEDQGGSSDGSVEDWMILDQVPKDGDSRIQLHLSYCITSSEEDTDDENTLPQDSWAVSKRDKESKEVSSVCRYFSPGQFLICSNCKKTGHAARSCLEQRKGPLCVLCGIQGHLLKECPTRPCPRCGLPPHGARVCDRPPVWHQFCQRCGVMGHLSDICPDIWRQFHSTIKMTEVPIRRQTYRTKRQKKRHAHCYNCSKRGHYGHECSLRRMISGTFCTLPFVCHFDEVHHNGSKTHDKNMEITSESQPLAEQPQCVKSFGGKKDEPFQRRNKMRKTWPEQRRKRQELKRLRREAQARREGGALGQPLREDEDILDSLRVSDPWQHKTPSEKTNITVSGNQLSTKKKDNMRKRKRQQMKHGLFNKEMDTGTEKVPIPKERVRHRRR